MCVLAMLFFRYLTLDTYIYINQHIIVQSVHRSWQMKEQLLGINIGFYLKTFDQLCKLITCVVEVALVFHSIAPKLTSTHK